MIDFKLLLILSKFLVILIIFIWRVRWIYFLDRGCSRVSEVEVARPTQVGQVTTKLRKIPVFGSLINLSPRKTTKVSKFLSISFSPIKTLGRWSKSPFASLRFNQPDNTCSCVGQLHTDLASLFAHKTRCWCFENHYFVHQYRDSCLRRTSDSRSPVLMRLYELYDCIRRLNRLLTAWITIDYCKRFKKH